MIRFEKIEVRFGDFVALPELDLEVQEGEFFTLLGPSGCGKTTALRALAGLVQPSSGDVYIDGRRVTHLPGDKREVGMVFQNYALFPTMNARANIAFGLKARKTPRDERGRLVDDIAERVDLSGEQIDRNLTELSGGQQQRVAIARALVLRPKILLLDEPLSNLDAKLRHQLRGRLKELQERFGITTVYVTHDQDEALSMSDRIAVFNQGRAEQIGTPEEIYDRSATEFVCTFIGDSSPLSPEFVGHLNSVGASIPEGTSYLRMEKTGLTPSSGRTIAVDGVVRRRSYHGIHSTYTVEAYGTHIKVLRSEDGTSALQPGDPATLHLNPDNVLTYPAEPADASPEQDVSPEQVAAP